MRVSALVKIALVILGASIVLSGCLVIQQEPPKEQEPPIAPEEPRIVPLEPRIVFEEITWVDETSVVPSGIVLYKGGSPNSPIGKSSLHWVVESSSPVDVYVVPSQADYNLLVLGQPCSHYPSLVGYNILKYDREGTIDTRGGIAIVNKSGKDATVRLIVSYYTTKIAEP